MKFRLSRTSDFNDIAPIQSPSKFANRLEDDTNEWGGSINKIELNTLEELFDFIEEQGRVVLSPVDYATDEEIPSIEIYDDYRE